MYVKGLKAPVFISELISYFCSTTVTGPSSLGGFSEDTVMPHLENSVPLEEEEGPSEGQSHGLYFLRSCQCPQQPLTGPMSHRPGNDSDRHASAPQRCPPRHISFL